jgi:hypothetical protein
MFLLRHETLSRVRKDVEGAKALMAKGYELVGECDAFGVLTKPLKELPKQEAKPEPKAKKKG